MKRLIFIISIFICIQNFASDQLYKQGNEQYANENYSIAISLYDSIINTGLESSEIYYNLGNCYYKSKDWANAIWHYEKSLKLNSNEKTINNLELVRLKIIDSIEPLPQLFFKNWWGNLSQTFSTKSWQILALLSVGFILILQLINKYTSLKRIPIIKTLSTITLIIFFIAETSYQNNFTKKEAIIFHETITVNSAPNVNSTNLFTLHEGTKVEIIDVIGDWINIKIVNGNRGWIKDQSVKEL